MARGATANNNSMPPDTSLEGIKAHVHRRLLETLNFAQARQMSREQLHEECYRRVDVLLTQQRCPLSEPERQALVQDVMDEMFGLGPLEDYLRDPAITDILVNGPHQVYVERNGRLELAQQHFRDDAHLLQVIQRIASRVGRRIDESSPMLDARLTDGSRVNAIIPPLAIDGPAMSVRRFGAAPLTIERLIESGSIAAEMAAFLNAAVRARLSILISGGTGSGKTTLLNILSHWIPDGERVVTIEDAAELQLQRDHVVRLETRPPNIEGKGEVTQRDLLRNTLRMRPDRIIIGESRGGEALDMLQAMNTGHEGSMTTVHANTPRDALGRVENMVAMAGVNFSTEVICRQIASAIDLVVHVSRLTGGRRRVMSIGEVTGMEGGVISLQELFLFRQSGLDDQGNAVGQFEVCGIRPQAVQRIEAEGITMPPELFQRRTLSSGMPGAKG